ncbi:unnamed protein product [Rotaria magnacalcarata]|nr:unnamed protein product [Rotaria magnacalcarata]CAF3872307.1 unnamed protein product [Rotaria magnacalcarata]
MMNTIKDILRNYTNWNNIKENPIDEEYPDQTKEDCQVTEENEMKKENRTKEDYQIKLKSSTVRQDISYILMILTLINRRFLF